MKEIFGLLTSSGLKCPPKFSTRPVFFRVSRFRLQPPQAQNERENPFLDRSWTFSRNRQSRRRRRGGDKHARPRTVAKKVWGNGNDNNVTAMGSQEDLLDSRVVRKVDMTDRVSRCLSFSLLRQGAAATQQQMHDRLLVAFADFFCSSDLISLVRLPRIIASSSQQSFFASHSTCSAQGACWLALMHRACIIAAHLPSASQVRLFASQATRIAST